MSWLGDIFKQTTPFVTEIILVDIKIQLIKNEFTNDQVEIVLQIIRNKLKTK